MVENRQAAALGTLCLFPVLASLAVAVRCLSRYLGRNYGWDDGLILLAWLLLVGQTATMYELMVHSHTGYHYWDIPPQTIEQQILTLKWSFAVQTIYHPLMATIRASIIMFLFRFQGERRLIRIALLSVFWINVCYLISTTLATALQCSPARYMYLKPVMDRKDPVTGELIPGGKCFQDLPFILASCGISIFMDLIILPIPAVMVWNLQMSRRKKVAVIAIMSVGVLATAVSVIRFVVYYYRFQPSLKDRSWNIGGIVSLIEPSIGIIAACVPAMKRLFSSVLSRFFDNNETSSSTRLSSKSGHMQQQKMHDREYEEEEVVVVVEPTIEMRKQDSMYSLRYEGNAAQSRELVYHGPAVQFPRRTRSVRTGNSEPMSEALRSEPAHVLDSSHQ